MHFPVGTLDRAGTWDEQKMKRFFRDDRGYALVLTLVFLPALLGLSLLMIDVGRGNNAHSDHQAAADALALAGARELDGGADAIDRARAAMDNFSNTVSYLARSGPDTQVTLTYEDTAGNEFTVIFLRDIPATDNDPIDQAWVDANATTSGPLARYVYVRSQARDLDGFFFNPATFLRPSVPVGAQAVATYRAAACNVTPLFICNPFEGTGLDLQDAYQRGQLHGRLFRLIPKGNGTAAPGNFGFLSATDANGNVVNGANELRKLIAGERNAVCYNRDLGVTTQPGRIASIADALNTRFDIYERAFRPTGQTPKYPPADNVRKGWVSPTTGQPSACNQEPATDLAWARPFGDNAQMLPPGAAGSAPGAQVGSGGWSFADYWNTNHVEAPQTATAALSAIMATSQFPNSSGAGSAQAPGATGLPSRYEVYRYEIETTGRNADRSRGDNANFAASNARTREDGLPQCADEFNKPAFDTGEVDRRVIFAAIIDCNRELAGGRNTDIAVNTYASIFLVNPSIKTNNNDDDQPDRSIDVEIVDIAGRGGNGTLEAFLREEAFLVR